MMGGGAERGLLSPRKPLVGREELRRTQPGTARCAAERSGGAAGGCSGGPRGPISVRWARSSRKRRAKMRP